MRDNNATERKSRRFRINTRQSGNHKRLLVTSFQHLLPLWSANSLSSLDPRVFTTLVFSTLAAHFGPGFSSSSFSSLSSSCSMIGGIFIANMRGDILFHRYFRFDIPYALSPLSSSLIFSSSVAEIFRLAIILDDENKLPVTYDDFPPSLGSIAVPLTLAAV